MNKSVVSHEVAQRETAHPAEHQLDHEAIVRTDMAGLDAEAATALSDPAAQLAAQASLKKRAAQIANEEAVPSADVNPEDHEMSDAVKLEVENRTAQPKKRGRVGKLFGRATEKVKSTYHLAVAHAYLAGNEATAAAKTKYDALDPKTQERLKSTGIGVVVAGTLGAVFAKISGMSGGGSNLAPMDLSGGAHHDVVGQAVHNVVAQKNGQSGQVLEVRHAGFSTPDPGDRGGHGAGNPANPNTATGGSAAVTDLQMDRDIQHGESLHHYTKDAGMVPLQERLDLLQDNDTVNTLIKQGDAKLQPNGDLFLSHSGTLHDPSKAALNEFHHRWVASHPAGVNAEVSGTGIKLTANHNELTVANGQGSATIELPDGYNAKVDKDGVLHITTPKNEELKLTLPKDALTADGQLSAEAQKQIADALKANGLTVDVKQSAMSVKMMDGHLAEDVKPGETGVTPIEYNTGPNSHKLLIQNKNGTVTIDVSKMTEDGWVDAKGAPMNALPTHAAITDADGKTFFMELDKHGQLRIAPDSEFGKLLTAGGRHVNVEVGIWDGKDFHVGATAVRNADPVYFGANFENIKNMDSNSLAGVDTEITVTASGTNTGAGTSAPAVLGRGGGNDPTTGGDASAGASPAPPPPASQTPSVAPTPPQKSPVQPTPTAKRAFETAGANQKSDNGDLLANVLLPGAVIVGGGSLLMAGVLEARRRKNARERREQVAIENGADILLAYPNNPVKVITPKNGEAFDPSEDDDASQALGLVSGFLDDLQRYSGYDSAYVMRTLVDLKLIDRKVNYPDMNDRNEVVDIANKLRERYGALPEYNYFLSFGEVQDSIQNIATDVANAGDDDRLIPINKYDLPYILNVSKSTSNEDEVINSERQFEAMGLGKYVKYIYNPKDETWGFKATNPAAIMRRLAKLNHLPTSSPTPGAALIGTYDWRN